MRTLKTTWGRVALAVVVAAVILLWSSASGWSLPASVIGAVLAVTGALVLLRHSDDHARPR